ncbi:MAG: GGDEF domain-containing protein [Pseudomonadota bacterium]
MIESYEIARKTVAELERIGAPATPQNFNIWFAHFAGENPSLSAKIADMTADEVTYTDELSDELFETHFANQRMGEAVVEASGKIEAQMQQLIELLEASGQSTSAYAEALQGASGQLGRLSDPDKIGGLVNGLLGATRAMEAQNAALETKLGAATHEITELRTKMETVRAEALSDALTGLANRKAFDSTLKAFIEETESQGGPLCLIMTDVDRFKKFNDTWGHQTGDQVLKLVSAIIKSNVKGRDLAARYGGEEFAVLLPRTQVENAVKLAHDIRLAVEAKKLRKRSTNQDLGTITLSLGVALYRPGEPATDLIERADACLYAAKNAGRNCVIDDTQYTDSEEEQAGAA